jgi:hypothetical protein
MDSGERKTRRDFRLDPNAYKEHGYGDRSPWRLFANYVSPDGGRFLIIKDQPGRSSKLVSGIPTARTSVKDYVLEVPARCLQFGAPKDSTH